MKSLERRFKNIEKKNQDWSAYSCFAEAVGKQNFSRQTIHRWFHRLVNKNDYVEDELKQVLSSLEEHTKPPEDNKK